MPEVTEQKEIFVSQLTGNDICKPFMPTKHVITLYN